MMRPLATLLLFFIFSGAIAEEAALKLPPSENQPAPVQPQPSAAEPELYVISARVIERINAAMDRASAAIKTQQQEIERLRAIVDKGSCS